MKSIGVTELRENLSEVTGSVKYGHERITVVSHGKPAYAIISVEDLELLEMVEDIIDLEEANKALKRNDFVDWDAAKKELGIKT